MKIIVIIVIIINITVVLSLFLRSQYSPLVRALFYTVVEATNVNRHCRMHDHDSPFRFPPPPIVLYVSFQPRARIFPSPHNDVFPAGGTQFVNAQFAHAA
jgi:hypothetical protein